MGFLLLYLIFDREWAVYVSLASGLIGIVSPFLSKKIAWIWMKIARVLSYIVPNILLAVVFYVFLLPLAVISRLFRKDPLMLSDDRQSYFIEVDEKPEKSSFEKIW